MVTELDKEGQLKIKDIENQVPNSVDECCVMQPVAKAINRKLKQR